MARVLITGSADGLGRAAAADLITLGHDVVVHARSRERLEAVRDLLDQGAEGVVGDLTDLDQTRELADQVNGLGTMDAVIHNAAMYRGPQIPSVNVVAPYVLTALVQRPRRLVYLTSGMHRSGRADWNGGRSVGYSDSKLMVTTLCAAVARLWPDVLSNAVDPGWVPTKMGGPSASDDLEQGHVTQVWLAVSENAQARTSGGYWYHRERYDAHPAAADPRVQDELLAALAEHTGISLTG